MAGRSAVVVEVEVSEEFERWFMALAAKEAEAVAHVVGLLEEKGVALGFPYSSYKGIAGAQRAQDTSGGHPLPVFHAFDPLRRAVLLLGGDKTGDERFYETFVPHAQRIWAEYLADLEKEEKRK